MMTARMSDERRAELGPYFTERAFMLPKELLEVRAELDRAREAETEQHAVLEALADACAASAPSLAPEIVAAITRVSTRMFASRVGAQKPSTCSQRSILDRVRNLENTRGYTTGHSRDRDIQILSHREWRV